MRKLLGAAATRKASGYDNRYDGHGSDAAADEPATPDAPRLDRSTRSARDDRPHRPHRPGRSRWSGWAVPAGLLDAVSARRTRALSVAAVLPAATRLAISAACLAISAACLAIRAARPVSACLPVSAWLQ